MKALIVGYGCVGKAVASIFRRQELAIVDPKFSISQIKDFSKVNFNVVFVCVDTPLSEQFKTLNTVLRDLNRYIKKNTVVCCKSTALPSFYIKASKKYKNLKLVYSPEYLSHHSNIADFQSQTFSILGGERHACMKIKNIFSNRLLRLKNYFFTDIGTAAFIKYAGNSFLAFKITYFNELYNIHKKTRLPSTFNEMRDLLILDERVGASHSQVPGRDGRFGWGGHCLPKDVREFYKSTKSNFFKTLINLNNFHRKNG